ncbi:hypothetical protein PT2222_50267 [Paraburkholderia tropica]
MRTRFYGHTTDRKTRANLAFYPISGPLRGDFGWARRGRWRNGSGARAAVVAASSPRRPQ